MSSPSLPDWGPEQPLDVLLADGPVLAVNKPAGLLTVGAKPGVPTLERQVKEYLKVLHAKPGNVYLGIPHRLDRPVSGVILFARNSKSAARLAEQFAERRVAKVYWAILAGRPAAESDTLVDWLLKTPDEARVSVVPPSTPGARMARLHYRTLASLPQGTLIEVTLETGRMHQIRVQFASRGWPIWGDRTYGAPEAPEDQPSSDERTWQIPLHARQITFLHPIRYDEVTVTAPLPAAWEVFGLPAEWLPPRSP